MVISSLIVILTMLILFGIIENYYHNRALAKIPIRIHVNGARGKSSVTRLIAAGLRAGGIVTMGKTTGSAPRIIDKQGRDLIIHRLRSASIGEQVKLVRNFSKKKIEALVIECMAVQPQYQWIAEQKMIKSTISVITNVRPDHLDEMGSTMSDISYSLSNTIPFNGSLITAERDYCTELEEVSEKRNTTINIVDSNNISDEYLNKFPYLEHADNIAIALEVCKNLNIDSDVALEGMLRTPPDPGALVIWNLIFENRANQFVSAFAANDPKSTLQIWKLLSNRIGSSKSCIFLNTRADRMYRTNQLISLVLNEINPDFFIIRGDNLPSELISKIKKEGIELRLFDNKTTPDVLVDYIKTLDNHFIMGIGNIVGWGEEFVNILKGYKSDDS
tara:strand:- start:3645 stop:4811 length:1167 start_codon:yes stop_codon:yes gene_type:complete